MHRSFGGRAPSTRLTTSGLFPQSGEGHWLCDSMCTASHYGDGADYISKSPYPVMGVVAVGSWGLGNQATIEALACQVTVVFRDRPHRQSQPLGLCLQPLSGLRSGRILNLEFLIGPQGHRCSIFHAMTSVQKIIKPPRNPLHDFFASLTVHTPFSQISTNSASPSPSQHEAINQVSFCWNEEMTLNASMEAYLSLVAVLIMCVPGIVFLVQIWRKRKAKQTRNSGVLPICEERTWPSVLFYDTIFRPSPEPRYPFHPQQGLHLPFDSLGTRSMPDVNRVELVGDS